MPKKTVKKPKKFSERQEMAKSKGRELAVYKRDDMIQRARIRLSVQEQKCVLYAISKIQPDDTAFKEYTFDIKDFYIICGIEDESYTRLKATLKELRDRSWWMEIDDEGTESAVSWFSTVRTNKSSGKVTIEFHKDMMPFLLQLVKQDTFYTSYNLQYVLPMSCQYSPRLYEILKSYVKNNNRQWFFEIDEIKYLLDCQGYKNFNDFKRFILDRAVEEINKFTDINVAYDTVREGRGNKVVRINFYMAKKKPDKLLEAKIAGTQEMDGQMTLDDLAKSMSQNKDSVKQKFWDENFR